MSRQSLIDAYVSALPLTAVAIVSSADGACRIRAAEPGPGETIEHVYYFKSSHAEFVLGAVGLEGCVAEQPEALAARIEEAATSLGATWQTQAELQDAAAAAVACIVERVDAMRQAGGLKQMNAEYKRYRKAQVDKAEKALPYAAYLQKFTARMVEQVAASGRAIG